VRPPPAAGFTMARKLSFTVLPVREFYLFQG
jgi:hypothetical protein